LGSVTSAGNAWRSHLRRTYAEYGSFSPLGEDMGDIY